MAIYEVTGREPRRRLDLRALPSKQQAAVISYLAELCQLFYKKEWNDTGKPIPTWVRELERWLEEASNRTPVSESAPRSRGRTSVPKEFAKKLATGAWLELAASRGGDKKAKLLRELEQSVLRSDKYLAEAQTMYRKAAGLARGKGRPKRKK